MKKWMILSLALVAGMLTAGVIGHFGTATPATVHASVQWEKVFRTPLGLVDGAEVVAVVQHVGAEPGRVVGEGDDATPFTNNYFTVEGLLKGEHNGEQLVVEQTGGMLSNGALLDINDGGRYERGQYYLLFLNRTGEGDYYLINHQSRYRVSSGFLEGVDPTDRVIARLNGLSLVEARQGIEARARIMNDRLRER